MLPLNDRERARLKRCITLSVIRQMSSGVRFADPPLMGPPVVRINGPINMDEITDYMIPGIEEWLEVLGAELNPPLAEGETIFDRIGRRHRPSRDCT